MEGSGNGIWKQAPSTTTGSNGWSAKHGMVNNRRPGFEDHGCMQEDMAGHFHPPLYKDKADVAADIRVDEIGDTSIAHGEHFHPGL